MKSVKLNEFFLSCNKLETLDCYYYKNYVIGEQFEINYNTLLEEVLNEITTNLYSFQPNQANLYFYQLFENIDNFISKKDWKHYPTFSEEAKEIYEFQLNELVSEYSEDENLDDETYYLLYTPFKTIYKNIFFERNEKRLNLINSLKSKIETIKSIYFNGINKEVKTEIETSDKINIVNTKTSTTKDSIEINELNNIKENINSIVNNKIKWKGKPSQFGYLIIELIGKEWIELPTKSLNKSAELLLNLFDVDTSKGNLSKEINEKVNSLTLENEGCFKIKFNKKNK
jgi:hypothetical protein